MTINRSTLLDLPLPVTGTEAGTWGDVTNNGLTNYLDIAIAGMNSLTSSDFTAGALTIALTEGDASATNIAAGTAQYATIKVSSLAQNSTITAPASARSYRIINADATYNLIIKASGQTGVTFLPGTTGLVAFNGTDYEIVGVVGPASATDNAVVRFDSTTGQVIQNSGVTIDDSNNVSGVAQLNATTADLTNIEVTNIKAKDGTAAGSIADSTGVVTLGSSVLTTTDINGGTIDNTAIGGATPAAGAFTTLSASSTLSVTGAGTIQGLTVGRGAGAVSTNTAVGASALAANTTGSGNTAIGNGALDSNTTGVVNTAVGSTALGANTTGNQNTAIGDGAMESNTTGNYNTSVGRDSLEANTTGSSNTGLGWQALLSNTTASNNTAVGYQSLYSNTGGGNTNNTAVGRISLYSNTSGIQNTAVGNGAMYSNTTSSNNTAVGEGTLYYNTTGASNTALGQAALQNNTTATENIAVGYQAGYNTTTGSSNTAVGAVSLVSNQTGASNAAFGRGALNATTGGFNTGIGENAGAAITTGTKNTILGRYNGNQGGLDIRTSDNYIVLSDGDGNPDMVATSQTEWLMRSGSGLWTLFSNGGGNNSTYNGTLIGANKPNLTGQANASLPSWFIDIGGRAADGSTRPVATADKFSVGRQAAGGSLIGAANLFEVNSNGCVGLNTSAASTGTGITFPATQNASSDANTLDDYEEGTWTPTCVCTGQTITYTLQSGTYTKIGNVVRAQVVIVISTVSGAAGGNTTISGFPFANGDTTYTAQGSIGYNDGFANTVGGTWMSSTDMLFRNGTRSSGNDAGGFTAGGYIFITVVYRV